MWHIAMPVEEPSTASTAVIRDCGRRSVYFTSLGKVIGMPDTDPIPIVLAHGLFLMG